LTCTHREDIKLPPRDDVIPNKFPHLLLAAPFDLRQSKTKLTLTDMLTIMCTCHDMCLSDNDPLCPGFRLDAAAASVKTLNRSLRNFFNQIVSSICMVIPVFYDVKFRLSAHQTLKEFLLETLKSKMVNSEKEPQIRDVYLLLEFEYLYLKSSFKCKYFRV
jgi:hypothetical protein